jgi:hypothetical protein
MNQIQTVVKTTPILCQPFNLIVIAPNEGVEKPYFDDFHDVNRLIHKVINFRKRGFYTASTPRFRRSRKPQRRRSEGRRQSPASDC